MISHAHRRSAKPIKNAKNRQSLPKAKLQSFLFSPDSCQVLQLQQATGADTEATGSYSW